MSEVEALVEMLDTIEAENEDVRRRLAAARSELVGILLQDWS